MTEIQCFSHTLHNRDISVSAVMINGEPWFRAKDIAIAVGYANPRQAILHNVDEQDRKQLKDFKVDTRFDLSEYMNLGVYQIDPH